MQLQGIVRALLGAAGLAGCIAGLTLHAPAAAQQQGQPITITRSAPVAPSLAGTVAMPIKAQRFNASWERARRDASHMPQMMRLIAPARGYTRDQQIAYVQRAVHHNIRWISDATEYGRHDYWASAAETLARRAGDMEDRAIVKMQALKSLGVPTRDLYMTMGRDTVGGPITVLIVRSGKRYFMLDDNGGTPVEVDRRPEFQPLITLGYGASWVHGQRVAKARPGATSTAAAAATAAN